MELTPEQKLERDRANGKLGGSPTKRELINKKISAAVSKFTPERIRKLEEVFALDGTVKEACFYAEISVDTYYEWIKKNPGLSERFTALREKPFLLARKTIVNSLVQPEYAFKYMTKKKREEFGDSLDMTTKGEKLSSTDDVTAKAKAFDEWYKQNTK